MKTKNEKGGMSTLRATGKTLPAALNDWIIRVPFDSPSDYTPEIPAGATSSGLTLGTASGVQVESGVVITPTYTAAVFKGPNGAYPAQDFRQLGYVPYTVDSDHPIHDLEEFTVALWIRSRSFGMNPSQVEEGLAPFIFINGGEFPSTSANVHHGSYYLGLQDEKNVADKLRIKGYIWDNASVEWHGHDQNILHDDFVTGTWLHIVHRYRKSDSTFTLFCNGVEVNQQIRYAGPAPAGGGAQPLLGALEFVNIDKIFLAAWEDWVNRGAAAESWQKNSYSGQMKDILFYDRALTDAQVLNLYKVYNPDPE